MEYLVKESRKVWIPNHPTHGYRPGQVDDNADQGEFLSVVDEEGKKFQVPQAEALAVDPACLTGVEDLLTLGDFNEAALLHNIRVRYEQDKIYTGIGMPILISVNPYQDIPQLYSHETMRLYKRLAAKAPSQASQSLPIHLYSVADAAYRAMLSEKASQSIIISGESGAGKTEATKRMLAYLAELQTSRHEPGGRRNVESQVLDANPVLEAFGNAKTVRNDNSSRFGKFIEVEFDSAGKLLSAQISNYLLEKCRIVTQQPEERNYHIFYQLCKASEKGALSTELQLTSAEDFEYCKECSEIHSVDDVNDFAAVLDCMSSLGFSEEERETIFRVVAAVLHLGELRFAAVAASNGSDGAAVDEERLHVLCTLLGITDEQLKEVLQHRTLEDPLTEKIIHMPNDVSQASFTRHSMAKVIYARLFDWLVWRINESITHRSQKEVQKIGLLDIYGFEVFEWNSFEQLCINFANEKLQQHFNTHMFSLEQRLYTSEGINWSHITWQDNQPIIDCLDKRPLGLFYLVDSECLMPSGTDASLFQKIQNNYRNSRVIYKASRFGSSDFAVAHYAGEVVYSTETFLMKNTDKLSKDVVALFKTSKVELVRKLFTDPRWAPVEAPKTRRRQSREERPRQNVTVSMMFREQLERLVEDLNKTNPRYVRCIKPNGNKQPNQLDSLDVLRQLRCAGMLESIRIRRAGYAVRRPFKEFFARFRILAPHLVPGADPDYRTLCQRLVAEVEDRLDSVKDLKLWQLGQSRVFMKEELERRMEQMIVESAKRQVQTIQRCWRGYVGRKVFVRRRRATVELQAVLRSLAAREIFRRQQQAALQLQATFGSLLSRHRAGLRHTAAVQLQALLRAAAARARAKERARPEPDAREDFSPTVSLDASIRNAALNLGGGEALDSLRSELLARLEGSPSGSPPAHLLSSSFQALPANEDLPMRKTIVNQRRIMEQLQQQFKEALKQKEIPEPKEIEESEERQELVKELRLLRRENSQLNSSLLTLQEDANARATEAQEHLLQVSQLRAELEDVQYGHRDKLRAVTRQLQELQELCAQQKELLAKKCRMELEGPSQQWEVKAKDAQKADELEKGVQTRSQEDNVELQALQSQSSWHAERERLLAALRQKEQLLQELQEAASHGGKEVARWRTKCEELEAQVYQANRTNRKMQSAVGHITNAAALRGGDLQELLMRNQYLSQEHEKQMAELKKMDLERQDLQAEKENVKVSLDYFQSKYQATQKDLKLQREQSEEYARALALAHKRIRELEDLRRGQSANGYVSQGPGRQPQERDLGRQSLLTQLDKSGVFRS